MKHIKYFLGNGITILIVVVLISLALWLVLNQFQIAPAAPRATITQLPATSTPAPTSTSTPIATPKAGYTPGITGIIVTIMPPATPLPSPSPTPTPLISYQDALREGGVTVGGYTFSLPQEVPDELGPVRIIGWLPDSPNEIVTVEGYRVIAIDVLTGQIRRFSRSADHPIIPHRVQLLKNDQVVFSTYDSQVEGDANIWLSGAEDKQANTPIVNENHIFPLVAPDQEGLVLYNMETQQIRAFSKEGVTRQVPSNLSAALASLSLSTISGADPVLWLQSASTPASRWTAVYNQEHFRLIDLNTGESKSIPLRHLHARAAYWSPDGQQLAMLVTEGPRPIPFMKLLVLNVKSGQLQEIDAGSQYVMNVTWDPDSQQLLAMIKTGEFDGYSTSGLLLIDIASGKTETVSILHPNALGDFYWGLRWSPDGEKIAIAYSNGPGNYQLYRVDVVSNP